MQSISDILNDDMDAAKNFFKKYKSFLVIGLTLLILVFIDVSMIGSMRFYTKWVECGQRPIVGTDDNVFMGQGEPYYYPASSVDPFISRHDTIGPESNDNDYFCTEEKAEQAGYSASANYREFHHVDPNEVR